jgi:hypothetical protein
VSGLHDSVAIWLLAAPLAGLCFPSSNARAESSSTWHVEAAAPQKTPPAPNDIRLSAKGRFDVLPFSETDIATSHGLSEAGTKLKNQYYFLKASILGTPVEKRRVREHCKHGPKEFQLDDYGIGCAFIELSETLQEEKIAAAATRPPSKKKKSPKAPGPIRTNEDWMKTGELTYNQALNRLNPKSLDEGERLTKLALEGGCKTAVAGAALVNQIEDFLPEASAWRAIDDIYQTIADCLDATSPAHEQLHLRVGLLNALRGKNAEATEALNRALKVQKSPEEFRTLFWRGFLESKIRENKPVVVRWNPFWERLVTTYPLTQHAVLVHALFGEHPVSTSRENEETTIFPYTSDRWSSANLTNFIFMNLQTRKETRTAKEFSRQIEGRVQTNAMEPGMIMAHAHLATGNLRESMRVAYAFMKDAGTDALHPAAIRMLYPVLYEKEIERNSREIETAFVMSLIRQESSFNRRAESPRGAVGLMQVLPNTARMVTGRKRKASSQNLFEPDTNIAAGCKYLANQLESFSQNEILTLSAYNAGPTNANRWIKRYPGASPLLFADLIPFPETRSYVSGILRGRFWYRYLTGAFDKEQQKQNEVLYAEHLLGRRLEPNLASRDEEPGGFSFLARPLPSPPTDEEAVYTESF